MTLPPGLLSAMARTRLFTDAQRYVVRSIVPLHGMGMHVLLEQLAAPFSAYLCDKDEATLVLSETAWEQVRPAVQVLDTLPPYRLITCDVMLDFGLVGYFATLTAVLADAGVSILAFSAFSRDHIFVAAADFDRAWGALQAFIGSCQTQEVAFCGDMELV